jgi:hypothetical protein
MTSLLQLYVFIGYHPLLHIFVILHYTVAGHVALPTTVP